MSIRTASSNSLLAFRSELNRAIRNYFHAGGLLEVTTPLLRDAGSSEVHLQNIMTAGSPAQYLQTSPEYAMKCLLADSEVSLFQICPAFRGGEKGKRHSIEFQMLEWYRLGFSLTDLMDDLGALLNHLVRELGEAHQLSASFREIGRVSYRELFEGAFGINPHQADLNRLQALDFSFDHLGAEAREREMLDALFSTVIEPGLSEPTIVFDYPACQAALAEIKTSDEGDTVSDRFELYVSGVELANAYQELCDHKELASRFAENNRERRKLGRPEIPDDEALLAATEKLRESAGIALGIDRLAMVLLGVDSIGAATP